MHHPKPGDTYRCVRNNVWARQPRSPDETTSIEFMQPGTSFVVTRVRALSGALSYHIGEGRFNEIPLEDCELVEGSCSCPAHALLFGHLPGCPFRKSDEN